MRPDLASLLLPLTTLVQRRIDNSNGTEEVLLDGILGSKEKDTDLPMWCEKNTFEGHTYFQKRK